jgi:hypothetical protein
MKVYVSVFSDPDEIEVRARAESPGVIGDALEVIKPGESYRNLSYDELRAYGSGVLEIDDDGKIVETQKIYREDGEEK